MHRRIFIAGLAITALALPSLRAAEAPFVSTKDIDVIALLPAPPAPESAEDLVDLETSFRVYSTASATEHAKGLDEVKLSIFHFAPVIGPWFQAGKLPKTEALFLEVEAEAKAIAKVGKNHWQRIRPYHVAPAKFTDPIEHEPRNDYAYPSGHSTRGTLFAALLGELFPEKREALFALGREAGWLRVQGGVHYPSDIYAGRVLGQALARAYLQSDRFQHALAECRAELMAAAPH